MKSKKILLLEKILHFMAVAVLKRHKPKIVAITGSVGKTSTKTAVFQVLSAKFAVRENQKNYNNEIGIPLTILGCESGGNNLLAWFGVVLKWLWVLLWPQYPEILVLELGVDRPGDMAYFMSFVVPTVAIVTNVSASHLEFFASVEKIAKEKSVLVKALPENSFAILNLDDELVAKMSNLTNAQVLTFGLNQDATVNVSNLIYNYQGEKPDGLSFKLNYAGKNIPIRLKHILAGHSVYAALAAVTTGIVFKMNLVEIAQALEELKAPTGRMNLVAGMGGSYILDDTYNASPVSAKAALETLAQLQAKRKIAVLGDMLELGKESEAGHLEVLKKALQNEVDLVLLMGDRMKLAMEEFAKEGLPTAKIMHFENHQAVISTLQNMLKAGDFVLVKGSQGMRMEKIVAGILAQPKESEKLLCRQAKKWLQIPYSKP